MTKPLVLGLDASTQSVKALALGPDGIEAIASVHFGRDLPQFGAPEGFVPDENPALRRAPPAMWAEGIRLALARLSQEVDLGRVVCVAGAAQQHGLVCTDANGEPVFPLAPIWMDATTGADCAALNARFGEAELRRRTGSTATERFTGPQARKLARENPEAWERVRHCHSIASYLNSLLIGEAAPCDPGSASGQNLYDFELGTWAEDLADATAPNLLQTLPRVVPSNAVSGRLSDAFAIGGLPAGIPVIVWTGDNPDSLLGMGFSGAGEAVISLGTSDTLFASMTEPRTDPHGYGNVFCTSTGGYMALTCFTNGSLAREAIKRETQASWEFFDRTFAAETQPGNDGRLILPWFSAETTPRILVPGVKRNYANDATTSPAQHIRALLESQALAMRLYSRWMVGEAASATRPFARIGVTGGAAKSDGFLTILANVFQTPIERLAATETVALGAALRAWAHASNTPIAEVAAQFCPPAAAVFRPDPTVAGIYAASLEALAEFTRPYL